ncbi:helix-turn-helix domain-containing protein [Photobacterium sagamiensis]|uniref:sugar diacid recognition domain-containing protein n=1 Tax=Photobacterium sagamiensis TaxID=2910241 RepID=UPI003D0B47EF
MQLNIELAEQIVRRASTIIDKPINVMDNQGIIIASTDPARLYQRHGGALIALSEHNKIEMTDDMSQKVSGTKPGINFPIIFNDIPIGVIGISGSPEEVRQQGELVRMAAEMTVEHAYMLEETQWSERRQEELVLQWIDQNVDFDILHRQAEQLKIDISKPRVACVLEVKTSQEYSKLRNALSGWYRKPLRAEISNKQIVLLLKVDELSSEQELHCEDWLSLQQYLKREFQGELKAGLGCYFDNYKHMGNSFESAQSALSSGKRLSPTSGFYEFSKLKLPSLFEYGRPQWQRKLLSAYINKLNSEDSSLCSTLLMWFRCNCENKITADELYIHRNTLRYRLKRVEEILGIELSCYEHRMLVYLSLVLES